MDTSLSKIPRTGKEYDVAKTIKSQFPFGKFKFQTKQTVLGESGEVTHTMKCCHLVLGCNTDKTCMFALAVNAGACKSLNMYVLECYCKVLIHLPKISCTEFFSLLKNVFLLPV